MPLRLAPIWEPVAAEAEYFRGHPDVAAMATDDNKVVFNPFVEMSPEDKHSLHINESARIALSSAGYTPRASLTTEQRKTIRGWSDSPYSSDTTLARQTVHARILADDQSLAPYAPRQVKEARRFAGSRNLDKGKRRGRNMAQIARGE